MNPLVSIIVPVYKVEQYLHQCIDSLLNQTYPYLDIILVDDGSPDRSGAICDEYVAKDPRVRVVHQENRGLSGARNTALMLIESSEHAVDFVTCVDSDDWLETDTIKRCVDYFLREPQADVLGFGLNLCYPNGEVRKYPNGEVYFLSREQALRDISMGYSELITIGGKVFRASAIREKRFIEGRNYEDMVFVYDVLFTIDAFHCLPFGGYNYRCNRVGAITEKITTRSIAFFENIETQMKANASKEYQLYLNTMMVNNLWLYWYMARKQDEDTYRSLSQLMLPFFRRARKKAYLSIIGTAKHRLKLWFFLQFPRVYTYFSFLKK